MGKRKKKKPRKKTAGKKTPSKRKAAKARVKKKESRGKEAVARAAPPAEEKSERRPVEAPPKQEQLPLKLREPPKEYDRAEEAAAAGAPPVQGEARAGAAAVEEKPRRTSTAILPAAPAEELVTRARKKAGKDPADALAAYAELARTASMSKEVALEAAELARGQKDAELEAEFLVQALLADPADAELGREAYEKARASGELWAASRALQGAVESGDTEATRARRALVAEAVEVALSLLALAAVGLARGKEINRARKIFSLLLSEELTKAYLSVEGASSVFMLEGESRYRASSRRGEILLVEDVSAGTARLSFRCRGAGTMARAKRQAGVLLSKLAEALFSGVEVSMRAGDELAVKLSKALGRELGFSQYWPMPDGTLQLIFRAGSGDFETLTLGEGGASIEDASGRTQEIEIEAAGRELSRARERYVKVKEGMEKLEEGKCEEAEACARRALELDPLGAEPNLLMGRVHSVRGAWGRAAERFSNAADANPDSAVILNELGSVLMRAGNHREAANSFSAALEYDMRDEYRANLIEAWMLSGDVARAEKELERLKRKVGEDPRALAHLAHIQLHSDSEKAERMLRRALALDKKCGLAYVGLVRIACRDKALDEAAYYVERAVATKKPEVLPRLRAEPDIEPLRASGKIDELLSKATSKE